MRDDQAWDIYINKDCWEGKEAGTKVIKLATDNITRKKKNLVGLALLKYFLFFFNYISLSIKKKKITKTKREIKGNYPKDFRMKGQNSPISRNTTAVCEKLIPVVTWFLLKVKCSVSPNDSSIRELMYKCLLDSHISWWKSNNWANTHCLYVRLMLTGNVCENASVWNSGNELSSEL